MSVWAVCLHYLVVTVIKDSVWFMQHSFIPFVWIVMLYQPASNKSLCVYVCMQFVCVCACTCVCVCASMHVCAHMCVCVCAHVCVCVCAHVFIGRGKCLMMNLCILISGVLILVVFNSSMKWTCLGLI